MSCRPTSQASLMELKALQKDAANRGDHCLVLVLAGVELYARAGRELELLEMMRNSAEEMREAIPSAHDLRRLYERE